LVGDHDHKSCMRVPLYSVTPNARFQPPLEAGATEERTL
jgi:hypothetical protein